MSLEVLLCLPFLQEETSGIMSRATLQKRVWLMNLTLNARPLKSHKMGMSYTFLTSSEASPLWHSLHAFAVQCYVADFLLQYVFFMSNRSAAEELTCPAADRLAGSQIP